MTRVACRALTVAVLLASAGGCALPRWPIEGTVTSPFGLRFRGIRPDLHPGIDIAAAAGTPIHAMKAGRIAFAGTMSGYGLTVIIEHGPTLRTLYGHLSAISVQAGQTVERDAVIGQVGDTGNATAPHLHFEIRRWGRHEDPVPLLGSPPRR